MKNRAEITPGQLSFVIMQAMVGVGFVSLPRDVQMVAKGGSVLSIIFSGLLVQLFLFIMWALNKRFPTKTLFEFAPEILGKFLGKVISFLYLIYFLLICSLVLDLYTRISKEWVYFLTPGWILMLLMVLVSCYLVISDLRIIARFLVFVSFWFGTIFLLVYWPLQNANYLYILPIDEAGWINIFKAIYEATIGMLGFELVLVAYPFVEGTDKDKLKAASLGVWVVVIIYALLTFTCLVVYAPEEVPLIRDPVIYLLKAFRLPMVERLDLFFLMFGVMVATTTYMIYLYMAGKGIASIFRKVKYQWSVWLAGAISFLIALFPGNRYEITQFAKWLSFTSYLFIFAFPAFLLLVSLLRKRKEEGVDI
ncbi:GerAB/ArcD/ProY family transporter [Laceyella putida]|uniref:GerAB/ArcD/ProY family transporter n=1 Tax=Laceyella putida TaxID=110101 RepID=A0ABW2RJE4_9BACL